MWVQQAQFGDNWLTLSVTYCSRKTRKRAREEALKEANWPNPPKVVRKHFDLVLPVASHQLYVAIKRTGAWRGNMVAFWKWRWPSASSWDVEKSRPYLEMKNFNCSLGCTFNFCRSKLQNIPEECQISIKLCFPCSGRYCPICYQREFCSKLFNRTLLSYHDSSSVCDCKNQD